MCCNLLTLSPTPSALLQICPFHSHLPQSPELWIPFLKRPAQTPPTYQLPTCAFCGLLVPASRASHLPGGHTHVVKIALPAGVLYRATPASPGLHRGCASPIEEDQSHLFKSLHPGYYFLLFFSFFLLN